VLSAGATSEREPCALRRDHTGAHEIAPEVKATPLVDEPVTVLVGPVAVARLLLWVTAGTVIR
jgi:hypothetical protein